MRFRFAPVVALLFSLSCLLAACSGGGASTRGDGKHEKVKGDRTRVSTSEGVEPLWIQQCPEHTEHILAFCGHAQRKASYKMAYTEAYADAIGQLRRYIGQKVDARIEPDGQGGYRFQISGADDQNITIRGVWEGERWAEVYSGPDGNTHDCYVMITYPAIEYEKLLGAAREADAQRAKKAMALHEEGKQKASKGLFGEAAELYERAAKMLAQLKEPVTLSDGVASNIKAEQIAADLKQARRDMAESESTALVVLGLKIDGQSTASGKHFDVLQNTVQKWVASAGIKIRPGGLPADVVASILMGDRDATHSASARRAGKLLVLDIQCDFSKAEDGAFYSYARGGLRLIRTKDGSELYTADLTSTKGGHFSKAKANEVALKNLMNKQLKGAVQAAIQKMR